MTDVPDQGVNNIIFDSDNIERKSWVFFGEKVPRSQVLFIVQVLIIFIVVLCSVIKLCISTKCEEVTVWVALLSSSIGYMLPSPHL